jgi:hypothetical protein
MARPVERLGHSFKRGKLQERRLKTELDLKSFGDKTPYVKGLWQEKPHACKNRREVSKADAESHLPETLAVGETVKNPEKGSA